MVAKAHSTSMDDGTSMPATLMIKHDWQHLTQLVGTFRLVRFSMCSSWYYLL